MFGLRWITDTAGRTNAGARHIYIHRPADSDIHAFLGNRPSVTYLPGPIIGVEL